MAVGEVAQRGTFFVVVGPSGVGKNSLIAGVLEAGEELATLPDSGGTGIHFVPSITTRSMRPGEVEGDSYHFVSHEDFDQRLASGQILEWQEFFANRYGTSRLHIEECLASGREAITDVEVLGAYEILARLPLEACAIGVEPPSLDVLAERIAGRHQESEAQLALRRQRAATEMALLAGLDHIVVNDDLPTAIEDLRAILRAEASRRRILRRALAAGERPLFRTIHFTLGLPEGEALKLPAYRLGHLETSAQALGRALLLQDLRAASKLASRSWTIEAEEEVALERDGSFPYLELQSRCRALPE